MSAVKILSHFTACSKVLMLGLNDLADSMDLICVRELTSLSS